MREVKPSPRDMFGGLATHIRNANFATKMSWRDANTAAAVAISYIKGTPEALDLPCDTAAWYINDTTGVYDA